MIKFNYLIERNEGNEFTTFVPNLIPQELPSLVYIEGPNSSGKSTLLNLLALAFDGNNRADINENLKSKIHGLLDSRYQDVSFEIQIDSQNELIKFMKNKGKSNIFRSVEKGGKESLLNTNQISEKYNLIYDIPENPITRLNEMNNSLKLEHTKLEKITQEIINSFKLIQSEVKNSQDPKKLAEKEKELDELNLQYNMNLKDVTTDRNELNKIGQYVYTRAHNRAVIDLKEVEEKMDQIKKNIKTFQNKKDKSRNQIDNEMYDCNKRMDRDVENVIKYLKVIKYSIAKVHEFENITFDPIRKNAIIPQKYFTLVDDAITFINKLDKSDSKRIQAKLTAFSELATVLEKYQFDDIKLPGESKSIKQLLLTLRKEIEKDSQENQSLLAVDQAIDFLKELKGTLDFINNKMLPKYSRIINSNDDEYYDNSPNEHDYEKMVAKQSRYKKRILDLSEKCLHYGVNLTDSNSVRLALEQISDLPNGNGFRKNSDEENIAYLDNFIIKFEAKNTKLKTLEQVINRDKVEMEQMKHMKPHALHGKAELIEKIVGKLLNTKTQLVTYTEYLEKMNQLKNKSDDKYFYDYFDSVAFHLGNQLGSIRHIDKKYDVKKIDLINNQIITKENKIIRFNDMGTGQSQAAYLLSKLSTLDQRKVVVLFDEIAMMDKTSLMPVFDKLSELYNEGKLICAVVVQKAEYVNIIPLSEVL